MDRVVLEKAETIERCVSRTREEYIASGGRFETEFSHQDAAILNLQRACQAAIDMAVRFGALTRLPIPRSSRDAFEVLLSEGVIDEPMADTLIAMVGFRNLAVHDYGRLDMSVVRHIIEHRLDDLLAFSKAVLQADPRP